MAKDIQRRRRYWIDTKVQWAIIQKVLILNAAIITVLYLSDQFFFNQMWAKGENLGFPRDHVYFLFLKEQQRIKFWTFFWTSGIVTFLTSYFGMRFSHRLAGPIFRMKKEFKLINAGEKVMEVKLRDADFFDELADEFNTMTFKLDLRKDAMGPFEKDIAA